MLNILISALKVSPDIIERFVSPILPKDAAKLIIYYNSRINEISSLSASFGIIFIIYSSSKAIRILNKTFLSAYGFAKKLSYFRSVLMAAATTLCLLVITALSMFFTSFLLPYPIIIKAFAALLLLALSVLVLNIIHYIAALGKIKFRLLFPGSILSVISVCIASFGFALYFNRFSNFSVIYGTISAVMLLVLWLYIFAAVLISGAQINAELIKTYTKSG